MKASDEGNRISVRSGFQPLTVETVHNEVVNPVCGPIRNPCRRDRVRFWRAIGPGLGVAASLFNPLAEEGSLLSAERLVRVGWGHDFLRVIAKNAVNDLAVIWLAGNEGITNVTALQGPLFCI